MTSSQPLTPCWTVGGKDNITGGILLSAALLFGGLAITVVTIQTDEEEYEDE